MINIEDLKKHIIIPILDNLGIGSISAVRLLLGTAAMESDFGAYLKQVKGPALGLYQLEPLTYNDIYDNYLKYNLDLRDRIHNLCYFSFSGNDRPHPYELISNLKFATIMSRIHYLRVKEPLPLKDDLEGIANYYKKYYNTEKGKGTTEQFIKK